MAEGRELSGWGQIAEYLSVSVRTAQVYERDLGLPVHRLPGPKGRVWAAADELETWKLSRPEQSSLEKDRLSPSDGTPLPAPALANPRSKRLNSVLWLFVAILVVVLVGAVYGLAHLGHDRRRPTDFRVAGGTLTVLGGEDGHELWHHTFPRQIRTSFYTGGDSVHGNRCVFVDLVYRFIK